MPEPVDAGGMQRIPEPPRDPVMDHLKHAPRFSVEPSKGGMEFLKKIQSTTGETSASQPADPELTAAYDHLKNVCLRKFEENKGFIKDDLPEIAKKELGLSNNSENLRLETKDGQSLAIIKIKEGMQPTPGSFLQDLDIQLFSTNGQIDYNFQPDGIPIKRVSRMSVESRYVATPTKGEDGSYSFPQDVLPVMHDKGSETSELSKEEALQVAEIVDRAKPFETTEALRERNSREFLEMAGKQTEILFTMLSAPVAEVRDSADGKRVIEYPLVEKMAEISEQIRAVKGTTGAQKDMEAIFEEFLVIQREKSSVGEFKLPQAGVSWTSEDIKEFELELAKRGIISPDSVSLSPDERAKIHLNRADRIIKSRIPVDQKPEVEPPVKNP